MGIREESWLSADYVKVKLLMKSIKNRSSLILASHGISCGETENDVTDPPGLDGHNWPDVGCFGSQDPLSPHFVYTL